MLTNSTKAEDFDLDAYLEGKGGRDLTPDDLKYIFEHFVTEETSAERQKQLMDTLKDNTGALKEFTSAFSNHEQRICIIEEDKNRARWLIPVLISGCTLLLGVAGTAIAFIKLTK